ncbi:sigma-54-dependent Fis family transcriptional regulator [Pseudomonas granadensis]|uniref:sigma-54-dependent Fis family transcriptional regulator n=1 Tax=Pseudomonas granadensis TaxID=1421430 RepID=UPI0019D1ED0A|nr:sigma-54-dependent Fis family transcriptional regulator [Pseudomonas granadensis]MBN6774316.1 sigma-54-dependent Fis family transcriptional regulator [Pseudomonas granadensis]MBN6805210.1 sigma-54-dependent Fis family transcriptional regulator [Pseudomonas granadensis]MBN6832342.1 sigma-54-dependent Fis family transcriptional regulator [Pseudomonas granadensis]MBN6839404.1 sigma-54-dependent Fis family transcriptional regulator [Pseudomonas granadensis]MBN6868765.1 sigma-54-dependent Fis fa
MKPALINAHAQQVLQAVQGSVASHTPVADLAITRSWRRCLDQYRLDPASRRAPDVVEQARLQDHRAPLEHIIAVAHWQMNSLHQQLGRDGHVVLLTDARGVAIDSVFNDAERAGFQRAGLWLGSVWSEEHEGTNGVGTCLVERQHVTIRRDEHFRGKHVGLTCSASPIFDPSGELLAVLNLSSVREEQSLEQRFKAMALTNLSAKLIESCFFLGHDPQRYLLRFHPDAGFVGLLGEGLLSFDENARICSINDAGLELLGLSREAIVGQSLTLLLEAPVEQLLSHAGAQPSVCWPLRLADGRQLYAQLREPLRRPQPAIPAIAPINDARVCLEDPRLQRGFARALRVLERDVPVFLQGETGTGKEAFAAALHRASSRASQPFVAINCAAIPETLIESELFGYRGGSFTGARKEGMLGKLEQAHGGILFLDEIADMPLALQTRLLRVLEERQVVPLGATTARPLDIRLISASHQNLQNCVAEGRLREDLFYRIGGFAVQLPALRDRSDKGQLFDLLLREEAAGTRIRLDAGVKERLLKQPWPGNVRQLRTCLRTLVALAIEGRISLDDLHELLPEAADNTAITENPLFVSERQTLLTLIETEHWHIARVAARLGISRNTLYRKLRQHGITRPG